MILGVLWAGLASPIVHPEEFSRFLAKASASQKDPAGQVRVLQIGDSHLQAGVFGGRLRERFQSLYGSAGRGLVFPCRLAGSNGPRDLRWNGSREWSASNAVRKENAFPWGLSGWSLRSRDSVAELSLRLSSREAAVDSFAQVTVLGDFEGVAADSGWRVRDSSRVGFTVSRESRTDRIRLQLRGGASRLDGLVLQSARPGVLWSDVGVNGMAWSDLLKPSLLWRGMRGLEPDLVVLSLGTNDAWYPGYDEGSFRGHVREVLRRVRTTAPQAGILLTLPPDHALKAGRRRTAPNPRLASVIGVLRGACEEGLATCVDLRELMGGEGSWKEWTAQGLMANDHVHYANAGYVRQADLVADVLLALPVADSAPSRPGIPGTETAAFLQSQDSLLAVANWARPAPVETAAAVHEAKKDAKPRLAKSRKSTKDRKAARKKSPSRKDRKKRKRH